jgi:hypothetical protein
MPLSCSAPSGHPIAFHVDATGEIQNYETASREGIWWLPNDSISDYLILNNQGANPIQLELSLFDAAGRAFIQKISLGPRQTSRFSVRRLVQLGSLTGSYGGIKISTAAHAGSLDSLHFLFDTHAGFSALLKMFDHDPNTIITERDNAKTGVWTLRAPMLALSQPDPALAFPYGTTLQPQLFIRNTTSKLLTAALGFNWRGDSVTGKAQGPTLSLLPYETRRIDVAALQDGKIVPKDAHWTSVTVTTNSSPDEIMAVAASYDATLQRGAQTPFSDQLAFAWEGGMWEYDAQHNSLMTAGNGGTKSTRAALTLFYNHGTERYDLEQILQPDEQMWIDVGKLIREHVPDKNGKVLPADLSSGSYEFRDLNDKPGTLFEGRVVYEKTYGHVTYGCMICCDELHPWLTFNPLGILFSNTASNGVQSEDCNATPEDISDRFSGNWTTTNTNIATVDFYGTHSAVAVGSTTSGTSGPVMTQHGRICYNTLTPAGGGDNVNPTVTFGDTPLVPLGKPVQTTATVNPSTNTTPITLTISTTSGTGSATFGNGNSTMTITTTTSVTLLGVTASSTPDNMELDAKVGATIVGSMLFTVTAPINGAIPVNYRQTVFSVQPGAVLHFEYKWDSSSGNLADLSSCQVEEYVTFVGPNPYPWASPPYLPNQSVTWPSTGMTPISATYGGLQDNHGHADGWLTPYKYNAASSDQVYQFQCPYYQNNQWVQLMPISGQIAITRVVNLTNGNTPWTYQITKSGYSTSMNLP